MRLIMIVMLTFMISACGQPGKLYLPKTNVVDTPYDEANTDDIVY